MTRCTPQYALECVTFWRVHDYVTCILVGVIGAILGEVIIPHCRPFRWNDETIDFTFAVKEDFPSWTLAIVAVAPFVFFALVEIFLFLFWYEKWVTLHDPHLGWKLLGLRDANAAAEKEASGSAEGGQDSIGDRAEANSVSSREAGVGRDSAPLIVIRDYVPRESGTDEIPINPLHARSMESGGDSQEMRIAEAKGMPSAPKQLRNRTAGGVIVDVSSPVADYTDFHRVTGGKSDQPEGSTMHNLQKRWLKSVMPVAVSKRTWPQWRALLVLINHWLLTQAFSICLTLCITQTTKVYAGRLRPDFLSRLRMEGFSSANGDGYDSPPTVDWCGKAREGRLSFPSGHSSIGFASIVPMCYFVAFFLELWRYASYWRLVAAFIPLILPVTIAISRTRDNRHNFSDVLAGSMIGCVCAMLSVALNFTIVNRRYVVPRREPQ